MKKIAFVAALVLVLLSSCSLDLTLLYGSWYSPENGVACVLDEQGSYSITGSSYSETGTYSVEKTTLLFMPNSGGSHSYIFSANQNMMAWYRLDGSLAMAFVRQ